MRRVLPCLLALLSVVAPVAADQKPAPPDRITELKAKVESASEKDRCHDLAELIAEYVKRVDEQVTANNIDQALATTKEINPYADRCKEAATKSKHKLKNSEITLRKAARRLDEISHAVSVDDQPVMRSAVDHIEAARTQILLEMFKR